VVNNNESIKQFTFAPASPTNTARWNPLDEIRVGTEYETGDAQNLANLLVDPDDRDLLVELILHALYKRKLDGTPADLRTVDRMMAVRRPPIGPAPDSPMHKLLAFRE
jgi:type IV secretion system protein VirD4